jgi:prepilin-type processing-associated H-X9-DG protein
MEDITTTRDVGQRQFLAGAQAGAEVGDDGVGGEAALGQFQEPHPPGVGVAMALPAQEVTGRGGGVDAHEDRPAGLKDLVVGPDADTGQVVRAVDRKDGTANTLMAGEAADDFKPWGHPTNWRDPAIGINRSPQGFGSPHRGGAVFLFMDGSVRFIKDTVDPQVLKSLSTPAGGEPINPDSY